MHEVAAVLAVLLISSLGVTDSICSNCFLYLRCGMWSSKSFRMYIMYAATSNIRFSCARADPHDIVIVCSLECSGRLRSLLAVIAPYGRDSIAHAVPLHSISGHYAEASSSPLSPYWTFKGCCISCVWAN